MTTRGSIERVVLVDDSEPDNVFHEVVLRRAGFGGELHVFERAEPALSFLRGLAMGPLTLVLLDINMPGMNGWEFADAAAPILQENPALAEVVMLTSSGASEDRQRARQSPVIKGFLTKPLTVALAADLLACRCFGFD